ncbi:MAG: hypothetical protein HQ567_08670 [Candidatus Nealsonbacteria bacterium]|nr:hypothetical protein [Candidatus Nealsonbacteria bacterium]
MSSKCATIVICGLVVAADSGSLAEQPAGRLDSVLAGRQADADEGNRIRSAFIDGPHHRR